MPSLYMRPYPRNPSATLVVWLGSGEEAPRQLTALRLPGATFKTKIQKLLKKAPRGLVAGGARGVACA